MMRRQGFTRRLVMAVCLVIAPAAVGTAAAAALSFASPAHYGLGGKPVDLAAADMNGDGRPDIVAAAGRGIDVLRGRSRGRFASATRVVLGHRPSAIALGDLNGDGRPDVVTANTDGTVSVLLGDGRSSFVEKGTFPTGLHPHDVVAADLTGDAVPDVVTANADGLDILPGDGAGGLLASQRLPVGSGCFSVVAGDLDLDGTLDLAFTRYSWGDYQGFGVLLGDGAGGFLPRADYGLHLEPRRLALGDLNRDRAPDLAAADGLEGTEEISAFLGDGLGAFIAAARTVLGRNLDAWGLAVGDLNRDGRDDVVTSGRRPGGSVDGVTVPPGRPRIYLLLSRDGGGVTFERASILAGRRPGEVLLADFNRDAKLDLAMTEPEHRSVGVRLRGALPVLRRLSPARGRVGGVVTLRGRHFAHAVVRFGRTVATTYVSRSVSKIKVRVPSGTARGRVKVTVTTPVGRTAPRYFVRL